MAEKYDLNSFVLATIAIFSGGKSHTRRSEVNSKDIRRFELPITARLQRYPQFRYILKCINCKNDSFPSLLYYVCIIIGLFDILYTDATGDTSEITTREGRNITLPCKTSNGQSGLWRKTVWFKGSEKVISIKNGGHFIYSQRKYPITVLDKESIRLVYVDRYDHGNYSCRALYIDGDAFKNVQQNITLLVKG